MPKKLENLLQGFLKVVLIVKIYKKLQNPKLTRKITIYFQIVLDF